MKAVALYHPVSEHARKVEEYARDMERLQRISIELVSLESTRGAEMARLYDIVRYPAIVVAQDNGNMMKLWEGMPLPLMNEVAGYLQ